MVTTQPYLVAVDSGKLVYASEVDGELIRQFKGDTSSSMLSCGLCCSFLETLHQAGIPTYFIGREGSSTMRVKRLSKIPIKITVRNDGWQRLESGEVTSQPAIKLDNTSTTQHNPLLASISDKWKTEMHTLAKDVNDILLDLFAAADLRLMELTLNFGKSGRHLLVESDIIDSCLLWDEREEMQLNGLSERHQEIIKRFNIPS